MRRTYHTQSYLSGSVSHADSARLETYGARDAYANVNSETYGHDTGSVVTTTRMFEPGSGRVTGIGTEHGSTTIQDHGSRTATAAPGPDALRSATVGGVSNTLTYDDAGNVTRYDRATGDDRFIAWDARNLPVSVTEAPCAADAMAEVCAATATPAARETFRYGPSAARYYRASSWRDGMTQHSEKTFYAGGGYEELRFAGANTVTVIQKAQVTDNLLHVRKSVTTGTGNSATTVITEQFEYVHRDHLGSVEAISRYANGALSVRHLAYDPYGSRRATDWSRALTAEEKATLSSTLRETTTRGFTGHEQLDRVGLIHMNGRLYDPVLGRYLSPDAAVSHPGFSQGWNGYAYVSNSPLSYTDPTGMVQAGPGCNVGGVMCLESSGGGFSEAKLDHPRPVRFRVTVPVLRPMIGEGSWYGSSYRRDPWDVGYTLGAVFMFDYISYTVEGTTTANARISIPDVGDRPMVDPSMIPILPEIPPNSAENFVWPGEHEYYVTSPPICRVADPTCRFVNVVQVMNAVGVAPNQRAPFDPNSVEEFRVDVDVFGLPGKDEVVVTPIYLDGDPTLQVGVRNVTVDNHFCR